MRAVIDTNVWVSALVNAAGAPAQVLTGVRARRFELVISQPLLEELAAVLIRPRFARRFNVTADKLAELLTVLEEEGIPVARPHGGRFSEHRPGPLSNMTRTADLVRRRGPDPTAIGQSGTPSFGGPSTEMM